MRTEGYKTLDAETPINNDNIDINIDDVDYDIDDKDDGLDDSFSEEAFRAVMETWGDIDIYPTEVRSMRFDPVMTPVVILEECAYDVADIIDKHGRVPLGFDNLLEEKGISFDPDCRKEELTLDTGSFARQVGLMTAGMLTDVVETKRHCMECPFANECLAVSMTSPRNGRISKNERRLPGGDPKMSLVIDEYLIFGGFTPQERRIIFDMVCDILEEKDRLKAMGVDDE